MKWNDDLPNVSGWQPRNDKRSNLRVGLMTTCQAAQDRITKEVENERKSNIDNVGWGPRRCLVALAFQVSVEILKQGLDEASAPCWATCSRRCCIESAQKADDGEVRAGDLGLSKRNSYEME